jgi:hypothetical protein
MLPLLLLLDAALLARNRESGIHKRNIRACAFLIKVGPTRVESTHAQSTVYSSFICKEIRGIISRSKRQCRNADRAASRGAKKHSTMSLHQPQKRREIYICP